MLTRSLRVARAFCVLSAIVAVGWIDRAVAQEEEPRNRFEDAIVKFEEQDRQTPPPANPIVFVGSSSIRRWDTAKSFPDLPVINRGFGGSQTSDSVHFADRIVSKYKPPLVVFYAGDNDIGANKTAEKIAFDFRYFVAKVRSGSPKTKVIYVSIKPSIRRWNKIDTIREANAQIKNFCESDPQLTFVDIEKAMLGADGQPRKELFVDDGLHLSPAGYELWTSILRPVIDVKRN